MTTDAPQAAAGVVNLVVAGLAEAQPLISHYDLQRVDGTHPFPVYDGEGLRLVVAGLGRDAAAAATGFLFHFGGCVRDQAWLNVGVAGHGRAAVGSVFLAHKISAPATDQRWYPPRVFDAPCASAEVYTVSRIERHYADDVLYEMEAAGFVATATRLATSELVQVVKVVSDNPSQPVDQRSATTVGRYIREQLEPITEIVTTLRELASDLHRHHRPVPEYGAFVQRWHFTAAQRHRLARLLRRWTAMFPNDQALTAMAAAADAQAALDQLEQRLAGAPVLLPPL